MSYLLKDIIYEIEKIAPKSTAENWDNVGLMLGDKESQINKIMFSLDITEKVLDKAVEEKVNLIISHHPFIFKNIKNITMNDNKGKMFFKAIKNDINLYSAHTNLDFSDCGMNDYLLKKIGIAKSENLLDYKSGNVYKIVVFVPKDYLNSLRDAVTSDGAGFIGKYSDCTFYISGTGTFRPLDGTKPFIGSKDQLEEVEEFRLEFIVKETDLKRIVKVIKDTHPYEEVAYDIYRLENEIPLLGYGKFGVLKSEMTVNNFLKELKIKLNFKNGRFIKGNKQTVKRIGVFTGALDEKIIEKIYNKIDLLITGDIKYHTAIDIKDLGLNVVDAGHFNTEIIVKELLEEFIKEKFKNIDIIKNNEEVDPFIVF